MKVISGIMVLLFVGSASAKTAVFSEGPKELKVVITEDMAKRELEADSLRKAGKFDEAVEAYRELIELYRDDPNLGPEVRLSLELHYTSKIASCYREKGDYTRALEQYKKILVAGEQIGSRDVVLSALLWMGKLALSLGRYDGVLEEFEGRRDELPGELALLLGDIYRRAGMVQQARRVYLDILQDRLGPRQDGKVVLGCYGVPPEQREILEKKVLEETFDLESGLRKLAEGGNFQAQLLLGELAWERGEYRKALEEFQKAWEISPQDPMLGLQVARTFIELEEDQKALEVLSEVGPLLESPGELLELATAYQLAGAWQETSQTLRRLTLKHPESPEAKEAYLRLQIMERLGR